MEKLRININDKGLSFLLWLATVKKFDSLSIIRVLEKPQNNNELYNKYLDEIK
jgi:hypothetical protein